MTSTIEYWKDEYLTADHDYRHAVSRFEQDRALYELRVASRKLAELGISFSYDGTFVENAPKLETL